MMYGDPVRNELQGADTLVLIAFVFSILTIIGFVIAGIYYIIILLYIVGFAGFAVIAFVFVIYGLIFLVFAAIGIYVFIRINKLRDAIRNGDAIGADQINTVALGILALIFNGLLPGILLLVARSHTEKAGAMARSGMSGGGYGGGGYMMPNPSPFQPPNAQYYNPSQPSQYVQPGMMPQTPYATPPSPVMQQYSQPSQSVIQACPSCQRQVSASSVVCPYCGYKLH